MNMLTFSAGERGFELNCVDRLDKGLSEIQCIMQEIQNKKRTHKAETEIGN